MQLSKRCPVQSKKANRVTIPIRHSHAKLAHIPHGAEVDVSFEALMLIQTERSQRGSPGQGLLDALPAQARELLRGLLQEEAGVGARAPSIPNALAVRQVYLKGTEDTLDRGETMSWTLSIYIK